MKGRENWEIVISSPLAVFSNCLSLSDSGHFTSLKMELPSVTSIFCLLLVAVLHLLCFLSFQIHLPLLPDPSATSLTYQSESSPSLCFHNHSWLHGWVTQNIAWPTPSTEFNSLSQIRLDKLRVAPISLQTLYRSSNQYHAIRTFWGPYIQSWVTQSDRASHLNQQCRETLNRSPWTENMNRRPPKHRVGASHGVINSESLHLRRRQSLFDLYGTNEDPRVGSSSVPTSSHKFVPLFCSTHIHMLNKYKKPTVYSQC